MKKITLIVLMLVASVQLGFSQENYKRVTIKNVNEFIIHELQDIGLDLTCGTVFKNNQITLELFDHELDELDTNGISYTVLIENMQKFYSERAKADGPKAIAELEFQKAISAQIKSQKSFSINEVINNVGQHHECDELDWPTPSNWNLNPNLGTANDDFGGCLTYDMVLQELDDMRDYSIANGINIISEKLDASLVAGESDIAANKQQTAEGRTVFYLRISDNPDIDEAGEPETLYQSLIHSREAATVMNQLYFMWYILENYNTDTAIQNLVNNQALYFVPVFNPDGFVYNQTQAPDGGGGQRKNRNTSGGCGTYDGGIDLNRNSGYYWGNGGSSTTDNCSAIYAGPTPFSENETQIMRDFFLDHDFKLALNHHSYKNAMLHAYAGVGHIANPRPDEYSKYNHDMTHYNRYAHGPSTSISGLNSGNMNDWMLGGPNGMNPSNGVSSGGTGSGKNTLAWTPENGLFTEGNDFNGNGLGGFEGFWPEPSNYLPIAKRAMRMNFMAAYFSGKYAKLHDLNQSNINSDGDLNFAIENLGQNGNDTTPLTNEFTLTITPISNINMATTVFTVNFDDTEILDQKNISIPYTLPTGIQAEDKIEFKVVLTNDYASDNVLYEANIEKAYTPNVITAANENPTNLNGWTSSGSWTTTTDAFSGSSAYKSNSSTIYGAGDNETLQLNGSLDLTNMSTVLIQYHAKWDLERSYDYVAIEGSTDGSSWTELCGKLTKPGAPTANNSYSSTNDAGDNTFKSVTDDQNQNNLTALYDGDTQDKWNMEEVVIDASTNTFLFNQGTVFLRFRLDTDSSNRKDSYANADFEGFTFDNFKVIEIKIPCDNTNPPTGLTVDTITDVSALVSWDNIPSATYDIQYREIGAPTFTQVNDIATNSYIITGLTALTDYEVQVRTRCTSATSSYTSSTNFTTTDVPPPCSGPVITSYPYTEGFESGLGLWTQANNGVDDNIDWTERTGPTPSQTSGPTGPLTASEGSQYLYTESSGNGTGFPDMDAILNSPCFDLNGIGSAEFSFDYHMFGANMGDLLLEVSTNDGGSWTTLNTLSGQQQSSNGANWLQQDVDLSVYVGQIIRLRFFATTGSDFTSDISIDNINLTTQTPCVVSIPTNIVVSSITDTQATVTWDNIPSVTYDLQYREVGTTPFTQETNLITNSFDITGLTASTDYEVQVRSNCTSSSSNFSALTNFTTTNIVTLHEGYFETGLDNWTLSGTQDTYRENNTTRSFENDYSLVIQDDTGAGSTITSETFDLTNFSSVEFNFHYFPFSFEANEDFFLEFFDGTTWQRIGTYVVGTDFSNGTFDSDILTLDNVTSNFAANSRFRFECSASGNNDRIYIDQVIITAIPNPSSAVPNAVCQNINVQLDASGNATIVPADIDNGSSDDVAITNYSIDFNSFDCNDIGSPVNVILTVEDADGQTDTCTAIVTVLDQLKPTFQNVPGSISLSCGNNNPTWTDPTAIDNCDTTLTVNRTDATGLNSGDLFPNGTTVISYSVSDDNGNIETASFNVTIAVDNTDPNAVAQNITVQLDATGNATISPSDINNGSSDNCGIASLALSQTSFDCNDIGSNTVTLTVTDTNNNTDTANATVTITQQDAPTPINCWDDYVYNNSTCQWENQGTEPLDVTVNVDDCDQANAGTVVTTETNANGCEYQLTTITTWIGQDTEPITECWETATFDTNNCEWIVTNDGDTIDPVAICQNITIQLDGSGNATITASQIDNGSSDDCQIASITVSPSTFNTSNVGDNTVILTVVDESGNSVNCSAIVTVEEETLNNPVFTIRDISVIPNPFKNYFDIILPNIFSNDDFSINIYDLNGRIVFNKVAISINSKIRIDNLDNIDQATYFVKITHNNSGNEIIKKMVRF